MLISTQPINKEEKPRLFDELGGIPSPESDNLDDEDEKSIIRENT